MGIDLSAEAIKIVELVREGNIKRRPPLSIIPNFGSKRLVLGDDIGTTGSKLVAVDTKYRAISR